MLRWKSSLKPAAAAPATGITLEASATKTSATYSSPTNIDVNIPAVSANDILLLFVTTNDESAPTDSPPSGWTKITEKDGGATSRSTVAAYWKRASSSASATTETWSSFFPTSEAYYVWVGAYSGCVTSGSPVDAFGSSAAGYASVWSVDVTTTTADTMIVTISGTTTSYITQTWSDGTELIDTAYPSSATAAVSINEKLEATAGSKTRTATSSSSASNAMIAVALKPDGGGEADYRSTILADNPLFYYRLGEASGTTAYNEVTASSDGTYYNTPTLGQTGAVSGDSDTTVLFEQANSEYAETVTLTSETSLLPCTIECFIKTNGASDSNAGIVFYRSGSASASGLNIRGSTLGKLGYHWRDQSNTYGWSGGPTLSDNTWYYVALVVTSTEATFYVIEEDGTLTTAVNTVSHAALDCSNDGWHIARDNPYARYFQGNLDEVAIYDQALSQSTLVAHAAAAGYSPSSSIILEERFEESDSGGALGSATDGYDSSLVSSEVTTTGSTIDPDESTTSVLSGSKSLEIDSAGGDNYVEFDLGSDYNELWFHVEINRRYSTTSNRTIIKFFNQSGTIAADLRGNSSNKPTVLGASATTSFTYANTSAVDHFWLHWVRNSTSTFYFGANTSTRPTSGGDVVSFTAADVAIGKFQIGIFNRGGNYRYDDILVSTSEIGDDP